MGFIDGCVIVYFIVDFRFLLGRQFAEGLLEFMVWGSPGLEEVVAKELLGLISGPVEISHSGEDSTIGSDHIAKGSLLVVEMGNVG